MSVLGVIGKVKPDEIYNLAAQSHVQVSFDSPEFTADVDAVGVLRILEAVRQLGMTETCRIYQASTSGCMVKWKKCHRMRIPLSPL
jgi:GDPmannose 4,6-dehydratase